MLEPITGTRPRMFLPLYAVGQQTTTQLAEAGRPERVQHPSPFPLSARSLSPTRRTYIVRSSLFPQRASLPLSPRLPHSRETVLISPRRSVHIPANVNASHSLNGTRVSSPARYLVSGSALAPAQPDGDIRPASPYLVRTRQIAVDGPALRLQPGQMHSRSQEPITLHAAQAASPLTSPRQEARPRATQAAAADDCLVKQLKALQEAKSMAAAKQAESDQMIAKRQDELRRDSRLHERATCTSRFTLALPCGSAPEYMI